MTANHFKARHSEELMKSDTRLSRGIAQGRKPLVFIGSSVEGLGIARELERHLQRDARLNLWTSDIFQPGGTTISSLLEQIDCCDYAILAFSADDLVLIRDKRWFSPRDNVVFEAGLFIGRLGPTRTFIVYDNEAKVRIPTDLAGVTAVTYSGSRYQENPAAALSPVASSIRIALAATIPSKEIDFIKAFITFIEPDTLLTDSYSQILCGHYNTLCAELQRLEQRRDWQSLLDVKKRLREYFEYCGKYAEGVEAGRRYVRALEALGETYEALWVRVKHIAWLLILAGKHQAGRQLLSDVVNTVKKSKAMKVEKELLFYCHRYLAISFHRDRSSGDLRKAQCHLERARTLADGFAAGTSKRMELDARLSANWGNLALERRQFSKALKCYKDSLRLFLELGDQEHIGIANLQLAEAAITSGDFKLEVKQHLETAEAIFLRLGWIEGHARVLEQVALRLASILRQNPCNDDGPTTLKAATTAAQNAWVLFQRVGHQRGMGRVDELLRRLQAFHSIARPVPNQGPEKQRNLTATTGPRGRR